MKQITQNYKSGSVRLEEVAIPATREGGVLVRTWFSVVSPGTEGMKVREGQLSLLGKARARPDQVKKAINSVRQQGLLATYRKVMSRLDSLTPLGYAIAGEVVAVGKGAGEFRLGQRVACAGAGYANHAEFNFVPKNLVVPVPDEVEMRHAAFATLGAIALHGFRQGELQLGDTACVIGLGLLGQLLMQILRAAGVHVVGVDVIDARCRLAERCGATSAMTADSNELWPTIARMTDGHGVDRIFICAGGSSNQPIELAARLGRDRARVIDIGRTRLDLPWHEYYLKEMDVRFARSYGPGRYDSMYEEHGVDYPIGYVRWTERRNLTAFLNLVSEGKVQLEALVSDVIPFERSEEAYHALSKGKDGRLAIVFGYEAANGKAGSGIQVRAPVNARSKQHGQVGVGVIGAGAYATSMLIPHLRAQNRAELVAVATRSSLSAESARKRFGFALATTDYEEVLSREDIHVVVIATRHSSHARLVTEALKQGKAVYVEKPLALSAQELEMIERTAAETGNDRLMVGFNRRFSPMIQTLAARFRYLKLPIVMQYRVHAGQLEKASWYSDSSEGSRFLGEAGHFVDVMSYLAGSRPVSVMAGVLRPQSLTSDDLENVAAVIEYDDGSIGSLVYATQGGTRVPKEYLEVFGGGKAGQLLNFEKLILFEGERSRVMRSARIDKGQSGQVEALIQAVQSGEPMPIAWEALIDTTKATLAMADSWQMGQRMNLRWSATNEARAGEGQRAAKEVPGAASLPAESRQLP